MLGMDLLKARVLNGVFRRPSENVFFIVNDTNFCTISIRVLITTAEVSQSLAIESDFYDPKRIHFFITISSDSVNSLPGSLNFTRSYHNQLN